MRKISILSLIMMAACGGDDGPSVSSDLLPATDKALCVALGADYRNNVGTLAVVGLPSLTVLKDVVPNAISGDPVLRIFGKKLYVVNRTQANITVIDPTTQPWTVKGQFSTGEGTNPQDIAVTEDRIYVALYNSPEVKVYAYDDKVAGNPIGSINLGSLDEDGVPNANSIVVRGNRAYVTLDLLDTAMFPKPRGKGRIAVLDLDAKSLLTTLDLNYTNPYDFMFPRGDKLIVATFDDFSGARGCLEQVAPGSQPKVDACLVENSAVMGVINSLAVGPSETYMAVSAFDADFNQTAQIRRLNAAGSLMPVAMTPDTQIPTDVAYAPTNHLVYNDVKSGGLRVIDLANGTELTTDALNIGLTPAAANAISCLPL